MSGNIFVLLDPYLDILETLGLSLLTFIYFGCSILVVLSYKLADEIDLVFLLFFMCLMFQLF